MIGEGWNRSEDTAITVQTWIWIYPASFKSNTHIWTNAIAGCHFEQVFAAMVEITAQVQEMQAGRERRLKVSDTCSVLKTSYSTSSILL